MMSEHIDRTATATAIETSDGSSDRGRLWGREEVSDDDVSTDGSAGDVSEEEEEGLDAVLFRAAREIQNRSSRRVGTASMEEQHFREFFGTNSFVAGLVWDMLGEKGLCPEKSKPKHLLWTLYFLKVYPKQSPGCSTVGASGGAVDPKTMRKWVWQFIACIAELADDVVSFFMIFIINQIYSHPAHAAAIFSLHARSISRAG